MKKSTIYRCAVAVLTAGAMANPVYAANVGTWSIPGGRAVVIGGSSLGDLRDMLGQLQGNPGGSCQGGSSFGGWGGSCQGGSSSGGWEDSCQGGSSSGGWGNSCQGGTSSGGWGNNCPDSDSFGNCFPGTGNPDNDSDCWNRPIIPDKPIVPDKPETPDKPEVPDKPETPDKPEVPDKPIIPDEPEIPDLDGGQDAYAAEVVRLVNEERAKAGLPSLNVHTKAESAALLRAKEIERSFSHTRPNGSNFSTVLSSAGIRFQSAGENIAYGQATPALVMNDWMKSSGHRANILNTGFTSIAVGHYQNSAGVDYWVQLFLR